MLVGITSTNSDSSVGLYPAYQATLFWEEEEEEEEEEEKEREKRLSFRGAKKLRIGLSDSYILRPW